MEVKGLCKLPLACDTQPLACTVNFIYSISFKPHFLHSSPVE